ncbi:MAG: hypothetical protein EXR72_26530 [Myxococcales bacterium]|nr:hypothetical protein [Myxococcales bacterium]
MAGLLENLALFERVGDPASQARCLGKMARLSIELGDGARALRACRFGIAAAEGDPELTGDLWGIAAHALAARDHAALAIGSYRRAEEVFRGGGLLARAAGAAIAGAILLGLRDAGAARKRLREVLGEAAASSAPGVFASALCALGEIDLRGGDPSRAELCACTAEEALQVAQLPPSAEAALLQGRALQGMGVLEEARAALEIAVQRLGNAPHPDRLGRALEALAWVQLDLGAVDEARFTLGRVLASARDGGDRALNARVALMLASTWVEDNGAEALRHLAGAVETLGRSAVPPAELVARARELLEVFPSGALAEQLLARVADLERRAR